MDAMLHYNKWKKRNYDFKSFLIHFFGLENNHLWEICNELQQFSFLNLEK